MNVPGMKKKKAPSVKEKACMSFYTSQSAVKRSYGPQTRDSCYSSGDLLWLLHISSNCVRLEGRVLDSHAKDMYMCRCACA